MQEVDVNLVQHRLLVTFCVIFITANNGLHREKNVFRFPENAVLLFEGEQRVSPFYHDLGLDLVGLIGNFWIVAQLVHLVAEQLLNPILSSSHVSRKSLEEDEVTHILFHIRLLQSSISQLLEYNKAGSVP